ncbi:hypothetical protein HNR72_007320 [Streptomyces collinus]|uniref:Uncharacterized protein n=1 Tax=Streptomyces collinus TaxID=42684 RepID=A0AA89Q8G0_STRCU|nr:hypothetical protein [Streptomyces collinus]
MPSSRAPLTTGSHDRAGPVELTASMRAGWAPTPDDVPIAAHAVTPGRRARLSALFPGERLLAPAGAGQAPEGTASRCTRPQSSRSSLTE